MGTEYPLKIRIGVVDKATAGLRAINAKFASLTKPVRDLNNKFKALSDEAGVPRLMKTFRGVGSAVGNVASEAMSLGLKLAGMATAATVGFYTIVRGAVDAGDKLGEMAQRVGLTVDAYAQIQYAAAQADVEQEAFNSAMDQFNKRLGEAKAGGGPLLSFLQQVAPGLANQVKGAKSTEEALGLMTGAFEKVTDPGKRAALAAAAFGKSGLQMGQFLGQGTKALADQRAEFMRIAGSQEEFARRAGELDNASRRTGLAFGALRNAAMAKLFPALIKLSDALTAFIVQHGDKVVAFFEKVGAAIGDWVDGGGLEKLSKQLEEFIGNVRAVVKMMGGWPNVLILVGAIMAGPLLSALVGLTSAVYTLGVALLTTPVGWFLLAVAAIAAVVYLVVSNWSSIKKFFGDLFDGVKDIFGGFSDFIYGLLVGDMSKAWDGLKRIFKGGVKFVATLLDGLLAIFKIAFAPILAVMEWGGVKVPAFSFREAFGVEGGAPLNPAAALPPAAAGGATGSAHVVVDFANAPRGTRVTATPDSDADLDLSVGYSMAGP